MFCLVHTSQIYAIMEGLLSQNRKEEKASIAQGRLHAGMRKLKLKG